MKRAVFIFGCCLLLAGVRQANAGVIFSLGNDPQQPGEENILFNMGMSASTVTGITNQSAATVDFSSTTDTLVTTANGQAMVTAADGTINNISISVPGSTYQDLIFNPFSGGASAGSAMVTVTTTTGVQTFSYALGSGNNFLTITADNGSLIESTAIDVANGFTDLKQPRISGIAAASSVGPSGAAVPEPRSVLLMAGGMLIVLGVARAKKRAVS